MLKTDKGAPVLFLIFNRPGLTARVFAEIKRYKPPRLYIAADGPRPKVAQDAQDCARAREVIALVDWPCEVKTLLREINLGCKEAVSSAISWFFKHEEAGIILEDDALPEATFFRFCEELLGYYREDLRIMMISGDNFQFGRRRAAYGYYFSRYAHIWGWATWKRAWDHFDGAMKSWPAVRDRGLLKGILSSKREIAYWTRIFEKAYRGGTSAWSYQWLLACWMQNGLAIMPRVNLVSNIGFGGDGTHTRARSMLAELERGRLAFPLEHPPFIIRDAVADRFTEWTQFSSPAILRKLINIVFGK